MNVKMLMQDNVYDDVETAGVEEYTQYARSVTRRRHNMPIHTIAPPPRLYRYFYNSYESPDLNTPLFPQFTQYATIDEIFPQTVTCFVIFSPMDCHTLATVFLWY